MLTLSKNEVNQPKHFRKLVYPFGRLRVLPFDPCPPSSWLLAPMLAANYESYMVGKNVGVCRLAPVAVWEQTIGVLPSLYNPTQDRNYLHSGFAPMYINMEQVVDDLLGYYAKVCTVPQLWMFVARVYDRSVGITTPIEDAFHYAMSKSRPPLYDTAVDRLLIAYGTPD